MNAAKTTTLIDYGLGNIRAFYNIFKRSNLPVKIASSRSELINADKLILPGVGSFDTAISRLNSSGMRETLDDLVLSSHVPVLGICVGMQIMARGSEEGDLPGLSWVDAEICSLKKFQIDNLKLPHMGWNDVSITNSNHLFKGLVDPRYYFLHSYYLSSDNVDQNLATTIYGNKFTSAICKKNIFGVQFHPEKSHNWGIQLIENFATLV